MEQIADFFKEVMANSENNVRDRMRAAELLLKLEPAEADAGEVSVVITVHGENDKKENDDEA